jgi:TrmH family RNA methyltransferase
VRWVRELHARRRARQEADVFLVEGSRLAEEALAAGLRARLVLRAPQLDPRSADLAAAFGRTGSEVVTTTPRWIAACSDADTPPGLIVVVDRPHPAPPSPLRLALVADGLADPGNFGSLMRTCVAAGVDCLFLTPGSVDPFNPKVVRGAMGAHFHLPLVPLEGGPDSPALAGLPLWLMAAGEGVPYYRVDGRRPMALILGSEAHGLDPVWRGHAAGILHIPMHPAAESLNAAVAAAVVLFDIARQRGSP